MSQNGKWVPPPGLEHYNENRAKTPPEYLIPYLGKHVAWSADGTRILASGEDMDEVEEKLVTLGINPNQVVLGYVDDGRYSNL